MRLTLVGPVVDPAPSSVTIAVGATSGSAVVTVVDDDEVKDVGSVTVVASGGSLATDPTPRRRGTSRSPSGTIRRPAMPVTTTSPSSRRQS
ncbi:MAG: hypothetical protein OXG35_25165 [Acidobacteria bacterium]|nr:hypothetical protein [Acidobacteriota bacterium]